VKRIRVGIVGAGANTVTQHIPRLQALAGVEVVSVANRSRASAERVAQQVAIPTVYDRWEDLVAAADSDAIVVGTWPYLHARVTLAALAAGKHLLCEARMAMNAAEARQMYDAACANSHLVAQLVPSPYTLAVDATIQRLLAEGYLGELLAIDIHGGGGFIDHDAPLHWRQNGDLSGLNVLSLGIWYEALLRWVGEASRVVALGRTFVRQRRDSDGLLRAVRVPDHLDIVAEMACGAQARFQFSAVTGHAGAPSATLYGSEGTLRFSDGRLLGGGRGDAELREITIPDHERGFWRVEEEFIGAIRGTEQLRLTDFATGLKYMQFTEAVAQSMASGSVVVLPIV